MGRFTGLQYRLGDEVKVRAVSADMETSRIEFELIEEKPHKAPRESSKAERTRLDKRQKQ